MACRSLLLKLDQLGYIKLPARRRKSPNRMRTKVVQPVLHSTDPVECDLKELRPLEIISISKGSHSSYQPLFDFLLFKYHYLSYKGSIGENLKYLVFDRFNRPLCCLLFGSSAWKVSCRDEFIGWNASTRQRNVNYITNNMRFLILPWIRVYNLASHILARICRRIRLDWGKKYGFTVTDKEELQRFIDYFKDKTWTGNVRELESSVKRLITYYPDFELEQEMDPDEYPEIGLTEARDNLEKRMITRALEENNWNKVEAAAFLKISRQFLFNLMKKHGIKFQSNGMI
jgi:hypothetical protein